MIPFSSITTIALECKPSNGPSIKSKPYDFPKLLSLKSDRLITFSNPSAPQKRACAKGKSLEIHKTVMSSISFNSLFLDYQFQVH